MDKPNKEFISRLANDFVHFKIHGRGAEQGDDLYSRTATTMQTVTTEVEEIHSPYFEHVCQDPNLQEHNIRPSLDEISEEVLTEEALNWGRVASLFTFGGKLAEWFWRTHQEDKIPEVENWLTESVSSKDDWIQESGGWEDFNETFNRDNRRIKPLTWLKVGILASLTAAILTVTYKIETRCKSK